MLSLIKDLNDVSFLYVSRLANRAVDWVAKQTRLGFSKVSSSGNIEIIDENDRVAINPSPTGSSSGNSDVNAPSVPSSSPSSLAPTSSTSSIPPLLDSSKKRARKLTSEVWEHFEKKIINGIDVAICNYCKHPLKADSKNGTTAMRNHMGTCSIRKNSTIESCFEKQKMISVDRKSDGKVHFGNFTFDQDVSRNELARAIILHEYPISVVDHVSFRRFVTSLQPHFKMVTRNTIKEDILKIYQSEKVKLMGVFEKLKSRIAITTDMWTSNQKKCYMSITAHFIDESWVLQSRILRFIYVPAPHSKEVLAEELMTSLTRWNIQTKISTITVDNWSSNDGMIPIIVEKLYSELLLDGKILHMRCCLHILNINVKDGLSTIEHAIENIRDSVAFLSASPSRVEKFEDVARQAKVLCSKKWTLDCKTRWNSTYLMLQTAIGYKDLFLRLTLRDKFYTKVPSEKDLEMAETIAEKLEIFYNATELFSGTNYPTANCYFIQIYQLLSALLNWMSTTNAVVSAMAKKMFDKFDKYWSVVHIVLAVAVVLDLRYKMKVVEFYFPEIYGADAIFEIEQVKRTCYDLLHEYQHRSFKPKSHGSCTSSLTPPVQAPSISSSQQDHFSKLVAFLSNSSASLNVQSELDHYLDELVLPWTQFFDILNWWKANGIKYPTFQLIARSFLAIPISTIASESAFSTGGRVVSNHRSRLHPNTLEALMCSQNWLRNDLGGLCAAMDFMSIGDEE